MMVLRKNVKAPVMALLLIAIAVFAFAACTDDIERGESQQIEQSISEVRQQQLIQKHPVPASTSDYSQERVNLSRKAETWNQPGKTGFISLLSFGKVIGTFPVDGKVSSVNSALTTPDAVIQECRGGGCALLSVESPQEDGSYGTNGDAVFWYTPEGAYMEWNGEYFLSDFPMFIQDVPTIVYDATEDLQPEN